jgi:predicted GH43/DUF377 family glycosyl hydrolase
MSGFRLRRLGMIMEPESGNAHEVEGTLNPGAIRGPDGALYLFPRLVARGNYSRIGIARVRFNDAGDPCGVERLGIALEPEADYERRPNGGGGCEDPRVTYLEPLKRYVMMYAAFSAIGPRIAVAISEDLFHWTRLGLVTFEPFNGIDFVHVDNKDASLFPVTIPNHAGKMQLAIIHRPLFPGTRPEETATQSASRAVDRAHESIWISYSPMAPGQLEPPRLGLFNSHHRLATPVAPWEALKIGGGTPPVLTRHGWLIVYHGVSKTSGPDNDARELCYSAGVMVLSNEHPRTIRYRSPEPVLTRHGWLIVYHGVSKTSGPDNDARELCYSAGVMVLSNEHPRTIRYRSPEPVLTPELPQERHGTIANVVFPTGIDRRNDLGKPDRFDVYYGMADNRIGVARLDLPEHLPSSAGSDKPEGHSKSPR